MSEILDHLRRALLPDEPGLSDGQLLEAFLDGRDEAALAALVRRHGPMVWGVCRRLLGNDQEAEDAFQATFFVLVRRAGSIAARELLANWLYGVARQTARKARAMTARRHSREKQVNPMPEPAAPEQAVWSDVQPLLDQELSRLPARYRSVLVLCDLQGRTRKEVARQLGCPEGTVAGRLARARGLLAKRLTRRGLAVSGAALAALLVPNAASAGVPPAVIASTIQAASCFAAGQVTAAGVLSAPAVLITHGVLRTMFLSRLKFTAFLFLAGAGILTCAVVVAQPGTGPVARPAPDRDGKQAGQRAATTETKDDLKFLQGDWKVVALEGDAGKAPPEVLRGMHWEFKGSEVRMSGPGAGSGEKASVKVDRSTKPWHIDLTGRTGPTKGKVVAGIFKMENGQLIICLRGTRDAKLGRPTEFRSDPDRDLGMITLERIKE